MIRPEPLTLRAVERRFPLLAAAGLDVLATMRAMNGPAEFPTEERLEHVGAALDAIEGDLRSAPADPVALAGPLSELSAQLGAVYEDASSAPMLAGVVVARERIAAASAAAAHRRRLAENIDGMVRALKSDAAAAAAELARYIDRGSAAVLAAHDVEAARMAALALHPDGLTGSARADLRSALDVAADLPMAFGLGDPVERLGPGQAHAARDAVIALARERALAAIERERLQAVDARAESELAAILEASAPSKKRSRS